MTLLLSLSILTLGATAGAVVMVARSARLAGGVQARLVAKPGGAGERTGRGWRQRRIERQLVAALPAGLEAVSRSVRSGASLATAIVEAAGTVDGPLANEFTLMGRQMSLGQPLARCLEQWAQRFPVPDVRLAEASFVFALEAGGARSRALDGLAQSMRDRQALRLEVTALAAQAKTSALVMAVLPIGFLAVASLMDATLVEFLVHSALGRVCLVLGILLDGLGLFWMQRMVGHA